MILPQIVKCICRFDPNPVDWYSIIQSDTNENMYHSIPAKDVLTLLKSLHLLLLYCIQSSKPVILEAPR